MKGYLANLVERTLAPASPVEPRLRSAFESAPATDLNHEAQGEINVSSHIDMEGRFIESLERRTEPSKMAAMASAEQPDLDSESTLLPRQPEYVGSMLSPAWKLPLPSTQRQFSEVVPPHAISPGSSPRHEDRRERTANGSKSHEALQTPPTVIAETSGPGPYATRPHRVALASVDTSRGFAEHNRNQAGERSPVVKVTIGRVEVRANFTSPPAPQQPQAPLKRKLSLEDYLKSRNGGGR